MKTKDLIDALGRFDPEAEVRLCVTWPGGITETHDRLRVTDYGGGPQLGAAPGYRGVQLYVGCVLDQARPSAPRPRLDLGQYASPELAARVHDFYVVHKGLGEPLNFPEFDYEKWIPPRTTSGQYNEHVAAILREKLLAE
ncbi:MAG: hypothetical protein JW809_02105 [Pirellulales bacterium]|nr:hypothetical protein [Pirellulales bacterium]